VNPQSPAGVVLLWLAAWGTILGPVFLWRLLYPQSAPSEAADEAADEAAGEDLDDSPAPGHLAEDFTDSVPFETGVLIGPASGGEAA
jgi:hypothetical protein